MARFNLPPELMYPGDTGNPILSLYQPNREVMAQQPTEPPEGAMPTPPVVDLSSPDSKRTLKEQIISRLLNKQVDPNLVALQRQSRQAQATGIKALEEQAQRIGSQHGGIDLGPLLNGIDALTGGSSAKNYRAPKTQDEIENEKFQVQQMLQKARGELTERDIQTIKEANQQKDSNLINALSAIGRDERGNAGLDLKRSEFGTKLFQNVEKGDKVVSKANESIAQADNVIALANSNNPLADNSIPTFLARASGEVGNLSEGDKKPFGGSQSLEARISAALNMAQTGAITPENRQFIIQLANTMKQSAQRNKQKRYDFHIDKYSKTQNVLSKDELRDIFSMQDMAGDTAPPAPPAPTIPNLGGKTMSFEDWKKNKK